MPKLANAALSNAQAVKGNVALAHRDSQGGVSAAEQAVHAQDSGAIALIIVNTADELYTPGDLWDDRWASKVVIPVMVVSKGDGAHLARGGSTAEGYVTRQNADACARGCLASKNCTGFEMPNGAEYCSFWFNGACSGPSSRGWITDKTSSDGYAETKTTTFVPKAACPKQRLNRLFNRVPTRQLTRKPTGLRTKRPTAQHTLLGKTCVGTAYANFKLALQACHNSSTGCTGESTHFLWKHARLSKSACMFQG